MQVFWQYQRSWRIIDSRRRSRMSRRNNFQKIS